jgi:hypothetical protein
VAELTQALTARVWVEQAKGALVATEGLDPAAASERLRARAGAPQRTVADLAREVVQDARLRPARRTLGRMGHPPPRAGTTTARDRASGWLQVGRPEC